MVAKTSSGSILILLFLAVAFFIIYPTLLQPSINAEFSQNKVKKGTDVSLFITITNNKNETLTNAKLIVESDKLTIQDYSLTQGKDIGQLPSKDTKRLSTTIGTNNAQEGLNKIVIKFEYDVPSENKRYILTKIVELEVFE
jgi:uncharacterized membrane protein